MRLASVALLVAINLGVPVQAIALTVCKTSDAARIISQIQNQAADEGTTLDANPMSKATVQSLATAYCGQTQGDDPTSDNTQQIEFGCTMLSGMYQSQRVYWTTCPSHTVVFNIQSISSYSLSVTFYSSSRDVEWPGNNQEYVLNDHQPHRYSLSCKFGENICYGAWYTGGVVSTFWGVGPHRQGSCTGCCYICGSNTEQINLGFVQGE